MIVLPVRFVPFVTSVSVPGIIEKYPPETFGTVPPLVNSIVTGVPEFGIE